MNKKKGQVWVETAIYTLIAFSIIGLVLAFAKPKIEEMQDKITIEQSIDLMKDIDMSIREIAKDAGNKRIIEMRIRKGNLKIDSVNNKLVFEIESKYTYSEPGADVSDGNILIKTEKTGKVSKIIMTREYEHDLTFKEKNEEQTIEKSSATYKLTLSNKGGKIDFDLA